MATYSASSGATVVGKDDSDIFAMTGSSGRGFGGGGADTFNITGMYNQASGGTGSDIFNLGGKFNVVDGQEDGDTFTISGQNNTIYGGAGDDTFTLVNGSDTNLIYTDFLNPGLVGGNDRVMGANGRDNIYSGGGNDTLYGGTNADNITVAAAGTGANMIHGDGLIETTLDGGDYLVGGGGNDTIYGDGGNDTIYGELSGAGNDSLYGGSGRDTISGAGGNDMLNGGLGCDTLSGGVGVDTFVFSSTADSPTGLGNRDIINDFNHAQRDLIDISGLSTTVFNFIGTGAFTTTLGGAPEARFAYDGNYTLVQVDANHDGRADMEIQLVGRQTLVSGDFVL